MSQHEDKIAELEAELQKLRASVEEIKEGKFDTLILSGGIRLYDDQDNLRAALVLVNGEPAFKMWGKDNSSILLGIGDGAAEVTLSDQAGATRLKLLIDEDSDPVVVMNDRSDSPALSLSVMDDVARVMLQKDDKLRVTLSLQTAPSIQMYDEQDRVRVHIAVDDSGPDISIIDTDGRKSGMIS